jgi:short-subunit dehydrogenase
MNAASSRGSSVGATPDTMVIVGAGPGIGAAVAARFASAGYAVGLIARNERRLSDLARDLNNQTGVEIRTATADATDPDEVRAALSTLASQMGPPTALCFSPIPDIGLIKPVLDTRPEELMASLRLNIAGAAAAVESVLPAMREQRRGTLLFTTGSAAIHPDPSRATSAVTTTAATVYISLLRQALRGTDIRVGHTVIVGPIDATRPNGHHPEHIADDLWAHHQAQDHRFPSVLRLP